MNKLMTPEQAAEWLAAMCADVAAEVLVAGLGGRSVPSLSPPKLASDGHDRGATVQRAGAGRGEPE